MLPYIDIIQSVLGNTGLHVWTNLLEVSGGILFFIPANIWTVIDLSSRGDDAPLPKTD